MGLAHNPKIVTDGLVLYLDAANPKSYPGSGTTWYDLSKNGNNGTLTNGPTYSSDNKGRIVFDGVDDYAVMSSQVIPDTGDFTVVFAYQLTGSGGRGGLFERRTEGNYNGFSLGQGGTNTWQFTVSGTSSYFGNRIDVNFEYPLMNTWYVDAGVYSNGNTVFGYRNGVFVNSDTGAQQGNLSAEGTRTNLQIANRDLSTSDLPCVVSSVQIYNRALTANEIQQNFAATRGRYGI